eukprot:jgi/Botrbrau1/23274/Bobra.0102s0017.1
MFVNVTCTSEKVTLQSYYCQSNHIGFQASATQRKLMTGCTLFGVLLLQLSAKVTSCNVASYKCLKNSRHTAFLCANIMYTAIVQHRFAH